MYDVPPLPPRFAAPRVLGEGAYGVVCAARDLDHHAPVAVKLLKEARGDALRRFKNEFRALAGIAHRNLVGQHELVTDGERWLLVMELVDGDDFVAWVTGTSVDAIGALPTVVDSSAESRAVADEEIGACIRDADGLRRLIAASSELVVGLRALHATGRLHCDIKPSNVLVERGSGRVVILDLGLASNLASAVYGPGRVAGTPSYMSPEQAAASPLVEASDWYAVGAMMYQCLTGRLPFGGAAAHVLFAKQIAEPPPLGRCEAEIPEALAALVMRLIARDPAHRPDGEVIARELAALGGAIADDVLPRPVLGRTRELTVLAAALDAAPQVAFVHGAAGLGRTLLCDRLAGLAAQRGALVLRGRTYPYAHVPFAALDELVDGLADELALRTVPEATRTPDVELLARLFPALRDGRDDPQRPAPDGADPAGVRQRAVRAFPRVLAQLADTRPLVVVLDDLHAGDDDSAGFLTALIASGVAALVVVSYRDDEPGAAGLPATLHRATPPARRVDVALGTLPSDEILALARAASPDMPAALLAQAVVEAGGVPRFALEVARHARDGGGARLADALGERLLAVEPAARRLIAAVAVAGRPIAEPLALASAAVGDDALAALRTGLGDGWLRQSHGRAGRLLDVFHPRVRECVLAAVASDERAARHGALADAMLAAPDSDAETLAHHLLGAGRIRQAAPYLVAAAERAASALAFDHAADLHARAIELGLFDILQVSQLRARRAALLADAGRLLAAADEYLRAAAGLPGADELVRLAAEQMLRGGEIDRGLSTLIALIEQAGMHLPTSALEATPGLAVQRLLLAREAGDWSARGGDPKARFACDVAWTAASGLALIDPIRAADFQTRSARFAIASGDAVRIARCLVGEVLLSGWGGTRTTARTAHLVERARRLAAQGGQPLIQALAESAEAVAMVQEGRYVDGVARCRAAADHARTLPGGALISAIAVHCWVFGQFYLGGMDDLQAWIFELHADALERGNHNLATNLRLGYGNLAWLLRDGAEAALAQVDAAQAGWSHSAYLAQHYYGLQARAHAALWRGDGRGALACVEAAAPGVQRSLVLLSQGLRVDSLHLRARCVLAAAAETRGLARAPLLARAMVDVARLRRSHAPWARALGELHQANVRLLSGRAPRAEHAAVLLDACGMVEHAAAARHLDGGPPPTMAPLLVFS